jgi:hypothetical protein
MNFKVEFFRCCGVSVAQKGRNQNKYASEATSTPNMVPWGWGEGRNVFFYFPKISLKKYFYLSTLLNSNKKTSGENIDLN